MKTYRRGSIGSLLAESGEPPTHRTSSAAQLRRRIAAALLCGSSSNCKKRTRLTEDPVPHTAPHSGRLSDLLEAEETDSGSDEESPEAEEFEELHEVVRRLHCEEKLAAAGDVRRLAKNDPDAREALGALGAIPPIVGMLDSPDPEVLVVAIYALLNLGIRNNRNKAEIAKAGGVRRMTNLIGSVSSDAVADAIVAGLLGLTALDANKEIVGAAPGAVAFLVEAIRKRRGEARRDAIRAIYNLSLAPRNAAAMVEAGAVGALLEAAEAVEEAVAERALAAVASVVATAEGRREVGGEGLEAVVEAARRWEERGRQEEAARVLMVVARAGRGEEMREVGAEGALLEAALMGTEITQRRAERALEWMRGGGGAVAGMGSAPQRCWGEGGVGEDGVVGEGVRDLVRESLRRNMRRIERRARMMVEKGEGGGKAGRAWEMAAGGTSSKSLPF